MAKTHPRIWSLLVGLCRSTLGRRYGYTCDSLKDVEGPYLLLCNHNMDIDPILLGIAAGRPVRFVASEHILRRPAAARFITALFDPIYHQKGKQGRRTVVEMLRTLKEGVSVGLFPEGNRSFSGVTGPFFVSGKLAKSAGGRVVTARIEGGYLTQPRWSTGMRRGKLFGRLIHVYEPAELKAMSQEAVDAALKADLFEDAYATQARLSIPYEGQDLALGLESTLFRCPACGKIGTLRSSGDTLSCSCGLRLRYTPLGYLEDESTGERHTVTELDAAQREALHRMIEGAKQTEEFFSDAVTLQRIGEGHQVAEERRAVLSAAKTYLVLRPTDAGDAPLSEPPRYLSFERMEGLAVYSRSTIVVMMEDGTHYGIRGDLSFSALKYLYLYQFVTNKES